MFLAQGFRAFAHSFSFSRPSAPKALPAFPFQRRHCITLSLTLSTTHSKTQKALYFQGFHHLPLVGLAGVEPKPVVLPFCNVSYESRIRRFYRDFIDCFRNLSVFCLTRLSCVACTISSARVEETCPARRDEANPSRRTKSFQASARLHCASLCDLIRGGGASSRDGASCAARRPRRLLGE
jgi:hypothetical protein